jgi:hypothetical protein
MWKLAFPGCATKVFNLSVSISGSKSLCGKKDHLVAAVQRYAFCGSKRG